MGKCNVKYNSFKLFHKLKLFHLHNVCTSPVFLAIIPFPLSPALCFSVLHFQSLSLYFGLKNQFHGISFFFLLKRNRSFRSKQSAVVTVLTYGPL